MSQQYEIPMILSYDIYSINLNENKRFITLVGEQHQPSDCDSKNHMEKF